MICKRMEDQPQPLEKYVYGFKDVESRVHITQHCAHWVSELDRSDDEMFGTDDPQLHIPFCRHCTKNTIFERVENSNRYRISKVYHLEEAPMGGDESPIKNEPMCLYYNPFLRPPDEEPLSSPKKSQPIEDDAANKEENQEQPGAD